VGGSAGLTADLVGVAVFAASGASAGVAKRLDVFGVVFVGVVAALGGGILRDLLIGAIPPYSLTHWPYLAVAVAASLLLFWFHPLDAAGLGLFTATGTLAARDAGLPIVGAAIVGMITGIGGGLGRDVLTGEIPIVLRREIYAVASLFGAAVVLTLQWADVPRAAGVTVTAFIVFAIRIVSLRRHWSAPTPRIVAPGAAGPPEPSAGAARPGDG
jgi:uncharacterized membrane protein YeiH